MNLVNKSLFYHFIHSKINSKDEELSIPYCEKCMTIVSHVFLSEFIQCLRDSLKVNSVNSCHTKQRAVLEGVRCKGVIRCIPQTAAADLHALPSELADVDQGNSLISGNQEVLHTGSYHLVWVIHRMTLREQNFQGIRRVLHKWDLFTSHIVFAIF